MCSVMTDLRIDGWSMGVAVKATAADGGNFGIVQHQEFAGDTGFFPDITGGIDF